MRVVILNNFSYVTGGADRHCFDLARILRAAGHHVAFLSTAAPENTESVGAFVRLGVTNGTRDDMPYAGRARVAVRAGWNRCAGGAMQRLVRDFKPDVVHVHKIYPHLSISPVLVARRAGVPIVQTLHDYEFVSASAVDSRGGVVDREETRLDYRVLNTALFHAKRRWHVPAVTRWVAVSRAVTDTYKRFGIDSITVPNFTLQASGEVRAFGERHGVVFAGRLTRAKGVHDVIALARALPSLPVRVLGGGPLAAQVRSAAATLPNLTYRGSLRRAEVSTELRNARLCVVPSHWQEPGPLVCLEAMAAGTPVVAYRMGGLAEYVEDAGAGAVVADDATSLADACSTLSADQRLWELASAGALRAVGGTHSPQAYLPAITAVYHAAQRGR